MIFPWTVFLIGAIIALCSLYVFIQSMFRRNADKWPRTASSTAFVASAMVAALFADYIFGGGQ